MNMEYLNKLLFAITYSRQRQVLIKELIDHAKAAGFDAETLGSFAKAVGDGDGMPTTHLKAIVTLREELTAILNSGWDFSGIWYPHEGKEFCSEKGNILDLTEDQLTEKQAALLAVIRKFYRRWRQHNGMAA